MEYEYDEEEFDDEEYEFHEHEDQDDFDIDEEPEFYIPILLDNDLDELDAEEIRDLIFRWDRFYVDVTLYARIEKEVIMFKLIQPFDCEFIIVANSIRGGQWDSIELSGSYKNYREQSFLFIHNYIQRYLSTKEGNIRIKVDTNSFKDEIRFNPGCEVPLEMQE